MGRSKRLWCNFVLASGLLSGAAISLSTAATADTTQSKGVVVAIKPVHSLVTGVMAGVGVPDLIVDGSASPHSYSLKPSQARNLEQARLVFWIGPELETFLEKSIATLARAAGVVELGRTEGLVQHRIREGGAFEDHDDHHGHGDGKHDGHDDRKASHDDHAKHDDHDHAKHDDHDHAKHEEHDADEGDDHFDAHIWLDPVNARVLVGAIADALATNDPENAERYRANALAMDGRLHRLEQDLTALLAPVRGLPFIVFHDAYQYFEHRFGVEAAGTLTVSPDVAPGAERIAEIKAKIVESSARCVFAEPQFEPRLVSALTADTGARGGILDPLGADIEPGPDLYFDLLRNMAGALRDCLAGS